MEPKTIIKFLVKSDKTASETYKMLKKLYGDDFLSKAMVFRGHKQFKDGRESVEDEEHAGSSRTARTPEMIQKVRDFIAKDRKAPVRIIAKALGISIGKFGKFCAQFVPHNLRDHEKFNRVNNCRDIISTAENDPNLLKSIVTGDETWYFQYDPETKRQSAEWLSKGEPKL